MQHRHLNHSTYTLAAIDDVIARGALVDWQALRDECKTDAVVRQKIRQICAAYANDRYAQRHAFWALYVERCGEQHGEPYGEPDGPRKAA